MKEQIVAFLIGCGVFQAGYWWHAFLNRPDDGTEVIRVNELVPREGGKAIWRDNDDKPIKTCVIVSYLWFGRVRVRWEE